MASKKSGLKNMGVKADRDLGGALLKILAVGVAGGALLISGAKSVGEALLEKQDRDSKRLDERREADREAIRRIMDNDPAER